MKVAAIQLSSQEVVSDNLRTTTQFVQQAKSSGAELICLPEGFAYLGSERGRAQVAEIIPEGPICGEISGLCRELGVWIVAGGLPEISRDPMRPFNSSVVFSPRGEVVAIYRKMHLFDVALDDGTTLRESEGATAGDHPVVCAVDELKVGLSICYDMRFPYFYAKERNLGAHLLTVPAAFTETTGRAHWHPLLRARAIETQCFVVAPAQSGSHPHGRRTYGHSLIIGPWGEILAEKAQGSGVITADLDIKTLAAVRRQMPLDQHWRPLD